MLPRKSNRETEEALPSRLKSLSPFRWPDARLCPLPASLGQFYAQSNCLSVSNLGRAPIGPWLTGTQEYRVNTFYLARYHTRFHPALPVLKFQ
jgi:hypothetical protein